MGKIIFVKGKKQEDTPQIGAGDIGAVTKLAGTNTGDMLCDPSRPLKCEPMEFPAPCLSIAFKPKAKGDEGKIAQAMRRLMEEDRTIAYENNVETKQQIVTGLGEQHLDVLVSKMKAKFGVDIVMENPRVPYRETIRKKVKVQENIKNNLEDMANMVMSGLNLSHATVMIWSLQRMCSADRCPETSSGSGKGVT